MSLVLEDVKIGTILEIEEKRKYLVLYINKEEFGYIFKLFSFDNNKIYGDVFFSKNSQLRKITKIYGN